MDTALTVLNAVWHDPVGGLLLIYLVVGVGLLLLGIVLHPAGKVGRWMLAPLGRFVSGRIMWRKESEWDARYEAWARELPEHIWRQRDEKYPYTTWGRRPGWQRQLVRLAAVAVYVAWQINHGWVVAAGVVAVTSLVVMWVARRMRRARYERLVGELMSAFRKRWEITAPPHEWVTLPAGRWEFRPVLSLPGFGWVSSDHPRLATPAATRPLARLLAAASTRLTRLSEWVGKQGWHLPHWEPAPDLSDPNAVVIIHHDQVMDTSEEEKVLEFVRKVANERLRGEWEVRNCEGNTAWMLYHKEKFPSKVELSAAELEKYRYPVVFFGQDRHGNDVTANLRDETPHVSVAASTGWGKTTIANMILSALLYWGAYALVIDPKRVGYVGAFRNLPNVELRTTIEGQEAAVDQVKTEMNRRYEIMEGYLDRAAELGLPNPMQRPEAYFKPIALVDDEKGSLTVALKQHWKEDGGKGTPKTLVDQQEILWRGRAAAIHVVTLAQQNNLEVFLNSDMRDQYMLRVLAGPQTASSWRMTFPGTKQKKVAAKKGRAMLGIGPSDPKEMQLAATTDSAAREAAEHGIAFGESEDQARAERLAQLTGTVPWEVSPLAPWMGVPAGSAVNVPVQAMGTGTDTPSRGDDKTLFQRPDLRILYGNGESVEDSLFPVELVVLDGGAGNDQETTVEAPAAPSSAGPEPAVEEQADDVIKGVAEAAAHLGYTASNGYKSDRAGVNAFKMTLTRQRGKGNPVPGETRRGKVLVWPRLELEEWHSKLPRAGARSSADDLDRAAGDA